MTHHLASRWLRGKRLTAFVSFQRARTRQAESIARKVRAERFGPLRWDAEPLVHEEQRIPGDEMDVSEELARRIHRADLFILVAGPERSDWVAEELGHAKGGRVPLLVVFDEKTPRPDRIPDTTPDGARVLCKKDPEFNRELRAALAQIGARRSIRVMEGISGLIYPLVAAALCLWAGGGGTSGIWAAVVVVGVDVAGNLALQRKLSRRPWRTWARYYGRYSDDPMTLGEARGKPRRLFGRSPGKRRLLNVLYALQLLGHGVTPIVAFAPHLGPWHVAAIHLWSRAIAAVGLSAEDRPEVYTDSGPAGAA